MTDPYWWVNTTFSAILLWILWSEKLTSFTKLQVFELRHFCMEKTNKITENSRSWHIFKAFRTTDNISSLTFRITSVGHNPRCRLDVTNLQRFSNTRTGVLVSTVPKMTFLPAPALAPKNWHRHWHHIFNNDWHHHQVFKNYRYRYRHQGTCR